MAAVGVVLIDGHDCTAGKKVHVMCYTPCPGRAVSSGVKHFGKESFGKDPQGALGSELIASDLGARSYSGDDTRREQAWETSKLSPLSISIAGEWPESRLPVA